MAKNAKKRTTTQGKPITDFFSLASKSHPQPPSKTRVSPSIRSQASSSEDIRPIGTSENTGVLSDSKFTSIKSKPLIVSSSKVHGREILDSSESKRKISSAISSRPPDFREHSRVSTPLKNNKKALSDRRRGNCDNDSDIEMANTIVHVNSTVCHSLISQWRFYINIFPAQSEKSQESSSFASRGFLSSGLPCSEQPVRRRGPRIHGERAGYS